MTKHTSRDDVWSEALKLAELRKDRNGLRRRSTFTPGEVAAQIDDPPSDRTVRDVVATMADKGHLERARTQGRYRHPHAGSGAASADLDQPDGALHGEGKPLNVAGDDDGLQEDSADEQIGGAGDVQEDRPDGDLEAVGNLSTPSLTDDYEIFEAAAFAIYDALRSDGPLSRADFQEQLHDEHTAGYENERTWWRRVAKPALKAHPDVVVPAGGNPWRYSE